MAARLWQRPAATAAQLPVPGGARGPTWGAGYTATTGILFFGKLIHFTCFACPCSVWRRHSHLLCRLLVRPWSCRALPPLELAAGPGQLSHRVQGPACHTSLS